MFKLSEMRLHFLDVSGKIGNGNIKCGRPQGGSNTPRPCTSERALSTAMMNCTTGLLYPFRRIFASVSGGWVLRPCVRMDFKRRWVTKLGAAFVFPADAGRAGSFCPLSCSLPRLAGVPFAGNFIDNRREIRSKSIEYFVVIEGCYEKNASCIVTFGDYYVVRLLNSAIGPGRNTKGLVFPI